MMINKMNIFSFFNKNNVVFHWDFVNKNMKTIAFNIEYKNIYDKNIVINDDQTYSAIVRFSYNRCCERKTAT